MIDTKQAGSDYYLQAGEPPGRWGGRGAQELGLSGQISEAERAGYDAVYAQTDPRTGERLGRRPADYSASYQATLDRLLDAEPHATAERWTELEWAAHKRPAGCDTQMQTTAHAAFAPEQCPAPFRKTD
jgi:hypothetical protein